MNIESDSPKKLLEAQDSQSHKLASESLESQGLQEPEIEESRVACLHGRAGRYQVGFQGDLIVQDSRDPETDLARALRGVTGAVKGLVRPFRGLCGAFLRKRRFVLGSIAWPTP